ncbi:PIF1 family ATP-dependent DNA helicase [Candidatus Parabeggiatoa sp. HSG14]|uniref:ATP-dependent DNA helicase n=1 Tax=Candidatus Parabeggiatoa sp. HSG14 TaxID=3055593 RepID=UPI0025A9220F|nr:PIF1 family ATP-dependent DNA helicase [Thiotrichales bacterium HSG14]
MQNLPRQKLCEIIADHGLSLCDDIQRFETLLCERCDNQYKREVFMLINALKEDIAIGLLNPPQEFTNDEWLRHLTQSLYDNLGFDKTLAKWVVQSWKMALNQNTSHKETAKMIVTEASSEALELTEEFSNAYDLMDKTDKCVFITGKAGTGKSTLLDYFKKHTKKKLAVLAPTGVAALNVGGATLHSFFRLPPRPIHPDEVKVLRSKTKRKLYQSLDIIVIDEVSMVRADMMDIIDRFMRLNGNNCNKPFGGVQMIFIGDLFQLPPVVSSDEEARLFSTSYKSPFFFSAKVFDEVEMAFVELTKVYRQKEQEFLYLLNTIRNNQAAYNDIQRINQRYQPQFMPETGDYYITLTTTNKLASQINATYLERLSMQQHEFEGETKGKFDKSMLPTDALLAIKEGAQVMFVKNDADGCWVNGTLGEIKKIKKNLIQVETPDKKIHTVKKTKWEILAYQFDEKTQTVSTEVTGSFTQYPLRLAWAITIHKSQGKQFDKVIVDLGRGTFAHGQLYVALSRCKTLEGLILKSQVRPRDVIVDNRVIEFSSSRQTTSPPLLQKPPSKMPPQHSEIPF